MHSFIITGNNQEKIQNKISELCKKLKAQMYDVDIKKINDVRNLNSETKLHISKNTVYVIRDIDQATDEALNAFLKNLEEPQENLFYILTAKSEYKILPTIISRCQIINTGSKTIEGEKVEFKNKTELLKTISSIRERDEALNFIENVIGTYHQKLLGVDADYQILKSIIREAEKCRQAIKKNGNITLHLTNFAITYNRLLY